MKKFLLAYNFKNYYFHKININISTMKLFITALIFMMGVSHESPAVNPENDKVIILPAPSLKGTMSVEEALQQRRSRRQFLDRELSMEQLSQIL